MSVASGIQRGSRQKRLFAFTVAITVLFGVSGGPIAGPVLADSAPYGQELYWTEDLGSPAGRVFGANQPIVIYQGSMAFVPGPICTGFYNGQNDFLYPATDVYIVPTGSVADYGALEDVSGTPNTIVAGASSGFFIEEYIGTAGGKFPPEFEDRVAAAEEQLPGLIPEGTYDVVYDECQDGKFQSTYDAIFSGVIVVDFAGVTPPFPSQALQDRKMDALTMRMAITEGKKQLETRFEAGYTAASVYNPSVAFVRGLGTRTMYADPAAVTLSLYEDQAAHYDGIFADPPDPAFDQLTLLGSAMSRPAGTADGVGQAFAAAAVELDAEARIAEALLHAMERYQGAVAAGDAMWALAQARAMIRHATLLQAQLALTRAALAEVEAAIQADPVDLEAGANDLAALAAAVAAGDDTELVRAARNAGLDDAGIAERSAALLATDWATWTRADVIATIDALQAAEDDMAAGLPGFGTALADAIAAMEVDPGVEEPFPVASAGGPYTGSVDVPLVLDASASLGGRLPIANYEVDLYEWDLDGDGQFDDATGATPSVTFGGPFHGWIGVRVTNGLGTAGQDVAYARADIASANGAPQLVAVSPASDPEVVVGSSQAFNVGVSDPEGDPVTLEWYLDGTLAGSGGGFTWTPSAIGIHSVEVVATDSEGAATTRSWLALGRAEDADDDGWNANVDCDDANAGINPGHVEVALNGVDDDCDPATSDDGLNPTAAFVSTAPTGGRNVALLDTGPSSATPSAASAIPVDQSPAYASNWALSTALNADTGDTAWAAGPAPLRYGVVRLWEGSSWLVDRIAIMPRVDYQPQRVRDFAVDVSTTGFANESDWTTVLAATAADSATLQSFVLPDGPVAARYIRVRLLSNRGDSTYISVSQFKVYSPQQSGGTTFEFEDRSTDPDSDIVSRLWAFGDGSTSTATNPSHAYAGPGAYTVSLTVTDSRGHASSISLPHRVLTPPVATVPVFPTINEKASIYTAGYGAADPDGERIIRMVWDWGDGTQTVASSGAWMFHQYQQDGAYTVRLTVTDAQEQTGFSERAVSVLNVAPSASLPNRTVAGGIRNSYSAAPSDVADPITCSWDFGDGSPGAIGCGAQLHAYPAPAPGAPDVLYTQSITVADDDTAITRTATIRVVARLTDRTVGDGLALTYDPPSFLAPPPAGVSCTWDFGDGSPVVTGCGSKVHAYPALAPGSPDAQFTQTLTVTDAGGSAALAGTITVHGEAVAPYYSTNFDLGAPPEFSGVTTTEGVQGYAGYGFGGLFLRNGAVPAQPTTLTLTGLPEHTSVDLAFVLAIIDSWDGNFCGAGPDRLTIRIDGVAVFSEVFENSNCGFQTYVPSANVTLARRLSLGFAPTGSYYADSAYNIGFDPAFRAIPHTGEILTIEFLASGVLQGIGDESWAIDNLEVFLNGVPDSNVAPTAEAGGPYAVVEGQSVTLDGSASSDPDGDPLAYAWDLDLDGDFDDATGATASLTPDDGPTSLIVRLRVSDPAGVSSTDEATIDVGNAPPTAVLTAPVSVPEGGPYTIALGGASDPSAADSADLEYAFDCGLGADYGPFGTSTSTPCTAGDDDVDAAVRASVRDKDGGISEYLATVLVLNAPPSGTFEATPQIYEGGSATLAWTSEFDPSSSDAAALHHSFACDGLIGSLTGSWIVASVASSTTCTFDDNGTFGVVGRVLDPDNASQTSGAPVSVENVPPSATIVTPVIVVEGSTFPISLASPSDPSAADTAAGFSYAFDCGDGSGFGPFSSVADTTCHAGDDGGLDIAAKIQDKDGGIRTYEVSVPVANVAPSVAASNDGPKPWGAAVSFSAGASDPSAADLAILAFTWDLDADGAFDDATGVNASRAFALPGTYAAQVRVCDDDTCALATTVATIVSHETSLALAGAATGTYSDPSGITAVLTDTTTGSPIAGAAVNVTAGGQSASAMTNGAGLASPNLVLQQGAGILAVAATFGATTLYGAASATATYTISPESASIVYSGDTFATGTSVRLAATVTEDQDGALGDISLASVTFDVFTGAIDCGSGTLVRYGPVAVADTGTVGDGIGTAEVQMATPGEQTYCIVARLTGAAELTANAYYEATPAQSAVLTVVSTSGKFATGGGWIVDPATGGRGSFGFTVRFTRSGSPKGQAVYVWRALYNGVLADFIVKSNSMTGLSFADELGNGTFPWRATLDGKATIRINRASDGATLYTDGNATFRLVAIDSGQSSGIGADSFAVRVLDKDGSEYRLAGSWSGGTYAGGVPLSGGNVMVHLR
ncbi:MAG: PKD domain-containing protein [Chloroflexota bacterium]